MKTIKVIIGIIIAFFSTKTIFEMYNEESGAGLFGAFSGYIIFMAIAIWLIYSSSKDEVTKVKNVNLENDTNSVKNYDKTITNITNLKELKEKGILTEEEFKSKVEKIEAEKTEQNLKNSVEYKQLKSLFESAILSKEEFESKISLLGVNYVVKTDKTSDDRIKTNTYKTDYFDFLKSLFIASRWIIGIFLIVGSTILGPLDQGLDNFDEVSVFQLILGLLLLPITTDYIKKLFLKKAK